MPAFVILILTSLCCYLISTMPSLTFILAIIWGTALISAVFYLKRGLMLVIYALNMGLMYAWGGSGNLLFYLAFFALAALVMSLMVSYNRDYYQVQKWGIITAVLCVSLFMGVVYLNSGGIGMKQMEHQLNSYFQESIKAYEDSGLMTLYEEQGMSKAEVEKSFAQIAAGIARHLPAFYYLQAIMVVFFMLLATVYVNLKLQIRRLKKRPYIQEIMPWPLVWVAIAGLGLWLLGREEMSQLYYAGSNILAVMVPVTFYFGLSALLFKIKEQKSKRKKWMIVALIVLSIVFPLSAVIFLCLLGLFDALLDFRHLYAR
ncbi:MAG: DUF2232 domain-containing protein [Syntrophomonas sp.]